MFCKECGTENLDEAKFCKSCGANLTGEATKSSAKEVDKKTLQLSIKPTFKWGYKFLEVGLWTLVFVILVLIYAFAGEDIDPDVVTFLSVIVIGIAIIYIVIKLVFEKLQYKKLEYNFYKDRVEYVDGFLNISQKELKYKFVREVVMKQNILQRIFKIGTIKLFTNASSGFGGYNNRRNTEMMNGIMIHCVENVKEEYKKIKELIDESQED